MLLYNVFHWHKCFLCLLPDCLWMYDKSPVRQRSKDNNNNNIYHRIFNYMQHFPAPSLTKTLLIFIFSFTVTTVMLWIGVGGYVLPLITHHVSAAKESYPILKEEQSTNPQQKDQTFHPPSTFTLCIPESYSVMKSTVCSTDERIHSQIISRMKV